MKKAIILAGGLSERLGEEASGTIKCMLPLDNEKILERSIRLLKKNKINDIVLVVGYKAEVIKEHFKDTVRYVEEPLYTKEGMLDSLYFALEEFSEPFLFMYADSVFSENALKTIIQSEKKEVTCLLSEKKVDEEAEKVKLNGNKVLECSKKIPLEEADSQFAGMIKFTKEGAEKAKETLQFLTDSNTIERKNIRDLITIMAKKGEPIVSEVIGADEWMEIDFPEEYRFAKTSFLKKVNEIDKKNGNPPKELNEIENQELFWKIRSEKYDNLNWANDKSYIDKFLEAGAFNKEDKVLDVGTGTGIIAHAVAPHVKEVVGLDISQDMLQHSNWQGNKYFIKRDARESVFSEGTFDKVTARMVFHHILEDTQVAMDECFKVLKKGGKFILSEGVPPMKELKEEHAEILKLKEKRIVFLEEDLIELMNKAGFKNIQVIPHVIKETSVKNWVQNGMLPKDKQEKILELHYKASDLFKKVHNLNELKDDCTLDITNLIIVGEK